MIGDIREWLKVGCTPKRAGRKFKIIDGYDPADPTRMWGARLHIEYLDDGSVESIARDAVMLGSSLVESAGEA